MIVFHYSTIYLLTYRNGLYLHVDDIFVALAPVYIVPQTVSLQL